MDKSQIRKLYQERQKEKLKKEKNSLIDTAKPKKGCKTCGKVTWKPKKNK